MTIEKADHAREKGMALVYVGIFLVPLLLCTGLAVDMGRGYLVRATLAKAVDAAALAAARNMTADSSQAQRAGNNIFNANFPAGYLGVSPDPPQIDTDGRGSDGSYIIGVSSKATMPTTFMRIANFDTLTVAANAQATRRLVDMSFVIDRSGSLKAEFPQVKQAAKQFMSYFDPTSDRIALITFSSNVTVEDLMQSTRGFDLGSIDSHIDNATYGGGTSTADALYQAWDQLRTVPPESRSGLRIVVLFTDGSPNSFPGQFQVSQFKTNGTCSLAQVSRTGTIATFDYPLVPGNDSTRDDPNDLGLYDTDATSVTASVSPTNACATKNASTSPCYESGLSKILQTQNKCIPYLPAKSLHVGRNGRAAGFPLYVPGQRLLISDPNGLYPNHVQNANNAARNLAESIANAIRDESESGSSRIRIYTLGLGDLLNQPMGTFRETGSSILQRIANDPASSDFNPPPQLGGQYFFAGDPAELNAAFQAVRDQIVRLTE